MDFRSLGRSSVGILFGEGDAFWRDFLGRNTQGTDEQSTYPFHTTSSQTKLTLSVNVGRQAKVDLFTSVLLCVLIFRRATPMLKETSDILTLYRLP